MSNTLSFGSRTDTGLVRSHNEDSLVAQSPLFAVADGMGGHEAGEVASEIAVETLAAHAPQGADANGLGQAVMLANRAIITAAANGVGKSGMGTTMTAAIIEGNNLAIAQVGDSRAYLLHGGMLQRLTRDHSLVSELVDQGEITEDEARWHPQRSVITRALGGDPDMAPDLYELNVADNDRLLLCSDGLSGMLLDEDIQRILMTVSDPQEATDALIAAANEAGGHDNITVIVVDILGESLAKERKVARRSHLSLAVFILTLIVAFAGAASALYAYAYNSAFLIAQEGKVAVYRGLTGDVAGIKMQWYEYTSDVSVDQLASSTAADLQTGIPAGSYDDAVALIDTYRKNAAANAAKNSVAAQSGSSTSSSSSSSSRSSSSSHAPSSSKSSSSSRSSSSSGTSGSGSKSSGQ